MKIIKNHWQNNETESRNFKQLKNDGTNEKMNNIEKHWKTMKHSKNTVKKTMKIRQIIIKKQWKHMFKTMNKQWKPFEKSLKKHNNIEKCRKHEK